MAQLDTLQSLRKFQIAGYSSIFLMIGVVGSWAALTNINGAVIAPAVIMAETNTKRVQHKDGGIVRDILVMDGDRVEAGQPLVVLDKTETQAELGIVSALLDEALAKRARLEAERDNVDKIEFPPDLMARKDDPVIAKLMLGQEKLYKARMTTLRGKLDQLQEQINQVTEQIGGLTAQIEAKDNQIKLIEDELVGLKRLKRKGLVSTPRVLAMQREEARLNGERGELVANRASAETKVGEVKLVALQAREDALTQSLGELRDTEGRVAELSERKVAAAAKLDRTVVKAPITGDVYQLAIHTEGGVIAPGENLMLISPIADELVLQAQVPPQTIEQIHEGQDARIRFTSFNSRTTPEIGAKVTHIAADTSRASNETPPFYMVTMKIPKEELALLGEHKLKPGMPAESFIQTGARSPMSYIMKPVVDQIQHAWRER